MVTMSVFVTLVIICCLSTTKAIYAHQLLSLMEGYARLWTVKNVYFEWIASVSGSLQ